MELLTNPFFIGLAILAFALLIIFSPFEIHFEDGEDIEW
jgi:hypothetical protein